MDRAEEPEEGEIVDVDDLEMISDYSMPSTPTTGKSVHTRDLLQDISLSSISDTSTDLSSTRVRAIIKKSKHHKRKRRRSSHHKRTKREKYVLTSSESEMELREDHVKQKQLKFIRVNTEIHHNSLRTRLKAMLGDNKHSDEEQAEHDTLQTLALLSGEEDNLKSEEKPLEEPQKVQEPVKDETDDELRQLRLDALKSAVITKAMKRKKRKGKENDVNKDNENCDNPTYVNEPETQAKPPEAPTNFIEEDVDVMRAIALASLSKNMANVPMEEPKKLIAPPKIPQKKSNLHLKQIKPFIINLESSDSDSELSRTDGAITNFLKKQRAAIEAKEKKAPKRGPGEKAPKGGPGVKTPKGGPQEKAPERCPEEKLVDKSVLRLLPKSQQAEYRLLQQKLLLARRKQEKEVTTVKQKNGAAAAAVEVKVVNGEKTINGAKVTKFQRTLEDMQETLQGRLQLKGKYRRLVPLLRQVNKVSNERQKHRRDFERLLKELQTVKDRLHASHQKYGKLAQQITAAKLKIDGGFSKTPNAEKKTQCTSTPLKPNVPAATLDISSIQDPANDGLTENGATEEKCDDPLKKYVSPLDSKKSNAISNPMTTYCPFELFGVCKDPECKFNHCATT